MLLRAYIASGLSASVTSASFNAVPLLACGFATRKKNLPEVLSDKVSVASKRKKAPPAPKDPVKKPPKEKVKRALSAYSFFVKEQVPKLDKSNMTTDHFTVVSQKWKSLSEEERKPYEQLAEEDKAVTAAARAEMKANRPPLNSYAKFVQELIPTLKSTHPGWGAPEMMRHAAEAWRSVSDADKARRTEQYRAAMAAYKASKADGVPPSE
jgi:hypothetical protein